MLGRGVGGQILRQTYPLAFMGGIFAKNWALPATCDARVAGGSIPPATRAPAVAQQAECCGGKIPPANLLVDWRSTQPENRP